jgi:tetratricopeptide (TPR) repeat protein
VEYIAFNLLALRAGYRTNQDMGSGLRAGIGFVFSVVSIDYALSPFDELGNMHRLGISVKFGARHYARHPTLGKWQKSEVGKQIVPEKAMTKLELFAEDYIALARKNLQDRQYPSVVDNIIKAGSLDPKVFEGEWGDKEKRLSEIIKNLKLREMPQKIKILSKISEQSNLAHESIIAYIEGKNTKSFLLAQAAFGTDPRKDTIFEEYLNLMSKLSEIEIRRDEILSRTALIKEKLKKAAAAFYVQKFDQTIKELEELLMLDENNELAWTRLGSAYYAAGDKVKAKRTYEKVLEINPNNKTVLEFMKIQGW